MGRKVLQTLLRLIAAAAVIGTALTLALFLSVRMKRGVWAVPEVSDVRTLRNDLVRVKDRVLGREPAATKTIYLERRAVDLTAGVDDAPRGVSSVIGSGTKAAVKTRAFSGSNRRWRQIVRCVADQFKDYDVVVTDERPASGDYMLAVVGGKVGDIGVKSRHVSGLAPFSGKPIPRAVVFAFSRQLGNNARKICETLAMEIAHAYGLDHGYYCPDVMTYLSGCGRKRFRDRDVPCGEHKRRVCQGGAKTQNSHRHLLRVLGPRAKK